MAQAQSLARGGARINVPGIFPTPSVGSLEGVGNAILRIADLEARRDAEAKELRSKRDVILFEMAIQRDFQDIGLDARGEPFDEILSYYDSAAEALLKNNLSVYMANKPGTSPEQREALFIAGMRRLVVERDKVSQDVPELTIRDVTVTLQRKSDSESGDIRNDGKDGQSAYKAYEAALNTLGPQLGRAEIDGILATAAKHFANHWVIHNLDNFEALLELEEGKDAAPGTPEAERWDFYENNLTDGRLSVIVEAAHIAKEDAEHDASDKGITKAVMNAMSYAADISRIEEQENNPLTARVTSQEEVIKAIFILQNTVDAEDYFGKDAFDEMVRLGKEPKRELERVFLDRLIDVLSEDHNVLAASSTLDAIRGGKHPDPYGVLTSPKYKGLIGPEWKALRTKADQRYEELAVPRRLAHNQSRTAQMVRRGQFADLGQSDLEPTDARLNQEWNSAVLSNREPIILNVLAGWILYKPEVHNANILNWIGSKLGDGERYDPDEMQAAMDIFSPNGHVRRALAAAGQAGRFRDFKAMLDAPDVQRYDIYMLQHAARFSNPNDRTVLGNPGYNPAFLVGYNGPEGQPEHSAHEQLMDGPLLRTYYEDIYGLKPGQMTEDQRMEVRDIYCHMYAQARLDPQARINANPVTLKDFRKYAAEGAILHFERIRIKNKQR